MFLSNGLSAQKDFLPASLTLAGGDTLCGYISYPNRTRTPAAIGFRRTLVPQVRPARSIRSTA